MLLWQNTYLPLQEQEVEVITRSNEIIIACIEFVYDSGIDNNDLTPKWWDEEAKRNIELRDVVAWRHFIK